MLQFLKVMLDSHVVGHLSRTRWSCVSLMIIKSDFLALRRICMPFVNKRLKMILYIANLLFNSKVKEVYNVR